MLEARQRRLQFDFLSLVVLALLLIERGEFANLDVLLAPHRFHVRGQILHVFRVELVDAVNLCLPGLVFHLLMCFQGVHFFEVVALLSSKPSMQVLKLSNEPILLLLELLVTAGELTCMLSSQLSSLTPIPLLLRSHLIVVPFVEAGVHVGTRALVFFLHSLVILEFLVPRSLALDSTIIQGVNVLVLSLDLIVVTFVL